MIGERPQYPRRSSICGFLIRPTLQQSKGPSHSESIQERVIGSGGSVMAVRGNQRADWRRPDNSLKIIRRCIDLFTAKIVDAGSFQKQASPRLQAAIQERSSTIVGCTGGDSGGTGEPISGTQAKVGANPVNRGARPSFPLWGRAKRWPVDGP